jgi:uncharacterized damage-inducible protein DinB
MIQQTPWIERKFEFNFPVGFFPVIIERLRGTSPHIEIIVDNKTKEELSHKTGEKWSVKEQVGHLFDLEELWYGRIEDFLSGKETLRSADMSNSKTHGAHHNKKDIEELLQQFSSARNKLIEKVEDMDETTASLTALHPRLQKPMRLVDLLFFIAEHDDHHLAKMRDLLNRDL